MSLRTRSIVFPLLTGLLTLSLASCAGQPASVAPADHAVLGMPEPLPVYHEASLAESPGLVAEAEKPLVLQVEGVSGVAGDAGDLGGPGQDVVPVRYGRGVEETVRWEGSGEGVAELWNEHGQLVYRVKEGGEPFTGLIPAGRYTMRVSGVATQEARTLVLEPTVEGARQQRDIYWHVDEADRGAGGPSFERANFKDQDFSGQRLVSPRFYQTRLERVSFAGADLVMARFDGVVFKNCNFDGAKLTSASFEGSSLIDCSFEGASLAGADFDHTNLYRTSMRNASLWGAYFHRSSLVNVVLAGADLRDIRSNWTLPPHGASDRCANYPGCGFDSVVGHFMAVLTYHR